MLLNYIIPPNLRPSKCLNAGTQKSENAIAHFRIRPVYLLSPDWSV